MEAKGKQKEFTDQNYEVIVKEQSSWEGGYVAEVIVKNTGEDDLKNWEVSLGFGSGKIVNSWNVDTDFEENNTVYKFKCHNDNRIIKPGEKTSFGYQVSGASSLEDVKTGSLKEYKKRINNKTDYFISYKIVNQWSNNATIEVQITKPPLTCMLIRMDQEGNMEICDNADEDYEHEKIVNVFSDDGEMLYEEEHLGYYNRVAVSTNHIKEDFDYVFIVRLKNFGYENEYTLADTKVRIRLYRNDEENPIMEREIPYAPGNSWEPFFIHGKYVNIYNLDSITQDIVCAVGGGVYYEG